MRLLLCVVWMISVILHMVTSLNCPTGYSDVGNSCLKLYNAMKLSWVDANASCTSVGAYMVVVRSSSHNSAIAAAYSSDKPLWLGFNDLNDEGTWRWTVGSSSYTNWGSGQPNNGGYSNDDVVIEQEDCAALDFSGNDWWDRDCGNTYSYICEVDEVYPSSIPSGQPTCIPTLVPSSTPSFLPTSQPSRLPSSTPSSDPTGQPTGIPSSLPSSKPSYEPTSNPTFYPSSNPSGEPSSIPSASPSNAPSQVPTLKPTGEPSGIPSGIPSRQPTTVPTGIPSGYPTSQPSSIPSSLPSGLPSGDPSSCPSSEPSSTPTCLPSGVPSSIPTGLPSGYPTSQPSSIPSSLPSGLPSGDPSSCPSSEPSSTPTCLPSGVPSSIPTGLPSGYPTSQPSSIPSSLPSGLPSGDPSSCPSSEPSSTPTCLPSGVPSSIPTGLPSGYPTSQPSSIPSSLPSGLPSGDPSSCPSSEPSSTPTCLPSGVPSSIPTGLPSGYPTSQPSSIPSSLPSGLPSGDPSSCPSSEPSSTPTCLPSSVPSSIPTGLPSGYPTSQPSSIPSSLPSGLPSGDPSSCPSSEPSSTPTCLPSGVPSSIPTGLPSGYPTSQPSSIPSSLPSGLPSGDPSSCPSSEPSSTPTCLPSGVPSSIPTGLPSGYPTSQPSSIPSSLPSGLPSGDPSSCPSSEPSSTPTCLPSSVPSSIPTGLPSGYPTSQPSSIPSSLPSGLPSGDPSSCPSSEPSSTPTCLPSSVPSSLPSGLPSGDPSSCPSSEPSSTPTCLPSGVPSSVPTVVPTTAPSVLPSEIPSSCPSSFPSFVPSGFPSSLPSSLPSVTPSRLPSTFPTGLPSGEPSSLPTCAPSCGPSSVPSTSPTSGPSSLPTGVPSCSPSRLPTGIPSSYPTIMPSGIPSNAPTGDPSSNPSFDPTSTPTCLPTGDPSSNPTEIPSCVPTYVPSSSPSSLPSGMPTCNPSIAPSSFPSVIPSSVPSMPPTSLPTTWIPALVTVAMNTTAVDTLHVDVILSKDGAFRCVLVEMDSIPSKQYVLQYGDVVYTVSRKGEVEFFGLIPGLSYELYCLTSTLEGDSMSENDMVASKQSVVMPCCKLITLDLITDTIVSSSSSAILGVIYLTALPLKQLDIHIQVDDIGVESQRRMLEDNISVFQTSYAVFPSTITYDIFGVGELSHVVYFSGSRTGIYKISLSLSGTSFDEYEVSFLNGNTITVAESGGVLPVLLYAAFVDDGAFLEVRFSSLTDRGNTTVPQFNCTNILIFSDAESAVCEWSSASKIIVTPSGDSTLAVGSKLSLRGNSLKGECYVDGTNVCSTLQFISPTTVTITSLVTSNPVVVVSAPKSVSRCMAFVLDLTLSYGSGGRPWSHWAIDIYSHTNHSGVQMFFTDVYQFVPPTPLDTAQLEEGYYRFRVTLCNFLLRCSTAWHLLHVVPSASVSPILAGGKVISAFRSNKQIVTAHLVFDECYHSGISSTTRQLGTFYTWEVFEKDSLYPMNISGRTRSGPHFLMFPEYFFVPGMYYVVKYSVYDEVLNVYHIVSSVINVLFTPLSVVLPIGNVAYVSNDNVLEFDGTYSYDPDNFAATFNYTWSCEYWDGGNISRCDDTVFEANGYLSAELVPSGSAGFHTFYICLRIIDSDSGRVGVHCSLVLSCPVGSPTVNVYSTAGNMIEWKETLKLYGSIFSFSGLAEWSSSHLDDFSVVNTLSPIEYEVYLNSSTRIAMYNLFLVPFAFFAHDIHVFTLSLSNGNGKLSHSSIFIEVNSPPSEGSFTLYPTSGREYIDLFHMHAPYWTDTSLPLKYRFGFMSVSSTILSLRQPTFDSFISTILPRTSTANSSVICVVSVFDSLSASREKTSAITVLPSGDINTPLTNASSDFFRMLRSGDIFGLENRIAVVAGAISRVLCASAPDCDALNRLSCSKMVNTCGECKSSYIGELGPANTPCLPSQFYQSIERGTPCTSNSSCLPFMTCHFNSCIPAAKSCVNGCSSNGDCIYIDEQLNTPVENCFIGDLWCKSVCRCHDGFHGQTCSFTTEEFHDSSMVVEASMCSLKSLIDLDFSSQFVSKSWVSLVYELMSNPSLLSFSALNCSIPVIKHILDRGLDISFSDMSMMLSSLDSLSRYHEYGDFSLASNIHMERLVDEMSLLITESCLLLSSWMDINQEAFEFIGSQFRLYATVIIKENNFTINTPLTLHEILNNVKLSSIIGNVQNNTIHCVVTQAPSMYILTNRDISTNILWHVDSVYKPPLQKKSFVNRDIGNITSRYILRNIVPVQYGVVQHSTHATLQCNETAGVYIHDCGYGVSTSFTCEGFSNTWIVTCPEIMARPVCNSMNITFVEQEDCIVETFSSEFVVCSCSPRAMGSRPHALFATVSYDSIGSPTASKRRSAEASVQKSLTSGWTAYSAAVIVIVLGVFGYICCTRAENVECNAKLQDIESIFPSLLFKPSVFDSFIYEFKHCHRWGSLFLTSEKVSRPRELRALCICCSTVYFMFLNTIVMGILITDNDSCFDMRTARDCTGGTSGRIFMDEICVWESSECVPTHPISHIKTIFLVVAVCAILCLPLDLLTDYFVTEVLARPTYESGLDTRKSSKVASTLPDRSICTAALNKLKAELANYYTVIGNDTTNVSFNVAWNSAHYHSGSVLPAFSQPSTEICKVDENNVPQTSKTNDKIHLFNEKMVLSDIIGTFSQFRSEKNRISFLKAEEGNRRLLVLFVKDLLSPSAGNIVEKYGTCNYFWKLEPEPMWLKFIIFLVLAALIAFCLSYIISFGVHRTASEHVAWIFSFFIWLVIDIIFVCPFQILVTRVLIPLLIFDEASEVMNALVAALTAIRSGAKVFTPDGSWDAGSSNLFNAFDYFSVSMLVAKECQHLEDRPLVLNFRTVFPRRCYWCTSAQKLSCFTYDEICYRIVDFAGVIAGLHESLEIFVYRAGTWLVVLSLILIHIELYAINIILVFIPLLVLVSFIISCQLRGVKLCSSRCCQPFATPSIARSPSDEDIFKLPKGLSVNRKKPAAIGRSVSDVLASPIYKSSSFRYTKEENRNAEVTGDCKLEIDEKPATTSCDSFEQGCFKRFRRADMLRALRLAGISAEKGEGFPEDIKGSSGSKIPDAMLSPMNEYDEIRRVQATIPSQAIVSHMQGLVVENEVGWGATSFDEDDEGAVDVEYQSRLAKILRTNDNMQKVITMGDEEDDEPFHDNAVIESGSLKVEDDILPGVPFDANSPRLSRILKERGITSKTTFDSDQDDAVSSSSKQSMGNVEARIVSHMRGLVVENEVGWGATSFDEDDEGTVDVEYQSRLAKILRTNDNMQKVITMGDDESVSSVGTCESFTCGDSYECDVLVRRQSPIDRKVERLDQTNCVGGAKQELVDSSLLFCGGFHTEEEVDVVKKDFMVGNLARQFSMHQHHESAKQRLSSRLKARREENTDTDTFDSSEKSSVLPSRLKKTLVTNSERHRVSLMIQEQKQKRRLQQRLLEKKL